MQLSDFEFHLPPELIARFPLSERSDSKLMYVNHETIQHFIFKDISRFFKEGDLLIFNNTKVIPARLYGRKRTGGQVELLIERVLDHQRILVQMRASKSPKIGDSIFVHDKIEFIITGRIEQFYELKVQDGLEDVLALIEQNGEVPLPPYLHRKPEEADKERYQTVYAEQKGSVAAPTAGFHFDQTLLNNLREKGVEFAYVTLHIGAGTFAPIRVSNIVEHKMHAEYITVSEEVCQKIQAAKRNNKRIVAVGTTTLRALESAHAGYDEIKPFQGDTSIFIYPGYEFKSVNALITNFHLPCSTLLMLVCAFGGYENLMTAYKIAVEKRYRFYSFGDAMFIEKY